MPADDQAALIDWLRERDVACPGCRYNLRGLLEPRCPECGQSIALSVTIVDLYVTAWIVMAIAVCGSAGLGFIFACIVLREGMPTQGPWLNAEIIFYIAMIPTPLPLLRTRRRFMRLSRLAQWYIAGGIAAVIIVALAAICGRIR